MKNSASKWLASIFEEYCTAGNILMLMGCIFGLGLLIFVALYIGTTWKSHVFSLPLCMTDECFGRWVDLYKNSLAMLKLTIDVIVALATAGGILVALQTYLSGLRNSALSNHIAHFSIFSNYINGELSKRPRISPESVDVMTWYNLIFTKSRSGDVAISQDYLNFISDLNAEICMSNDQAAHAKSGSFRYKPHQERLKKILWRIGIDIAYQPRNDFFEAEGYVFDLIGCVNNSFCYSASIPRLESRCYI